MASLPNFKISLGMPSGPTDFFLPIAANRFLTMFYANGEGVSYARGLNLRIITFATKYSRKIGV
jgi:hypothetical protein